MRCPLQRQVQRIVQRLPALLPRTVLAVAISLCGTFVATVSAQSATPAHDTPIDDLALVSRSSGADPLASYKKLSLEELMNLEVTSVSRRPEKLSETPSAVQVITGEEIRRNGATSIAQALRLAPNLQTAQSGAGTWNISARGFNSAGLTSNKLLVMIDGRTVYSPLFAGVFWEVQDVFLPDVDRIEVVSGPGGSTWGSNAVNGVINILTKSAAATQGGVVYAGAGNEQRGYGGLRYGAGLGEHGHFRVYAKRIDRDDSVRPNGDDARDRRVFNQTGFRADWDAQLGTLLTLQADVYSGWKAQPTAARNKLTGGNVLARWTRTFLDGSEASVQAYFDRAEQTAPGSIADRLDTYDLDGQHQFTLAEQHHIIWGVGGRISQDRVKNTPTLALLPARFTTQLISAFVQDELEIVPDRVRLTIGAKVEHNNYSGTDFSPNARVAWLVTREHTLWATAARAVRTPSRLDRDLFTPASPPFRLAGNSEFDSETVWAHELGWRGHVQPNVTWSLTGFYHIYDDLRSVEPTSAGPFIIANGLEGESWGAELSLEYELRPWWQWELGYTALRRDIQLKSWSRDTNRGLNETADPDQQVHLRTSLDLPARCELDLLARYVDEIPIFASGVHSHIPEYTQLDARFGWHATAALEFSVVGRNLLDRQHPEIGTPTARREIERSIHAEVLWRF